MPFLRFSRDKRGYEHTYLVQSTNRRGKPIRPRILYWYRTPPGVKLGRSPFDEEVRQQLEATNPGIAFDWPTIVNTPFPPPDPAEVWRERRRAEKAARQARREAEQEAAAEGGADTLPDEVEVPALDLASAPADTIAIDEPPASAVSGDDVLVPVAATPSEAVAANPLKKRRRRGGRRRRTRGADGAVAPGEAPPASAGSESADAAADLSPETDNDESDADE